MRLKLMMVTNSRDARRFAPRPYPGRVDMFLTKYSLGRKIAQIAGAGW
jgi:hypothetical protein